MRISGFFIASVFFAFCANSSADQRNEQLLIGMPPGYKVAYKKHDKGILMLEMLPINESPEKWREMLTTQIFYGNIKATTEQYFSRMYALWNKSCKGADGKLIQSGTENGYRYSFWLLDCPMNPSSKTREVTLFKAIKGNDSFYLVQKAWRYDVSMKAIQKWSKFMRKIQVCDSRIAESPCPTTELL